MAFHLDALSQEQLVQAEAFRDRDRTAAPADWSELLAVLPCNFRANRYPKLTVVEADILALLGKPDLRSELADGSTSLEYILGYTFRSGNRVERRVSIMIGVDQTCRCLLSTRQDRTR